MEKINKEDNDVLLIRGIMMFHASNVNFFEKRGVKAFCPASIPLIDETNFEKTICFKEV
uniref:Uncharacterized protein n=1 Tax=Meloidogyne incognita TaxID=6306 RepID=A0A914MJ97_MELIC